MNPSIDYAQSTTYDDLLAPGAIARENDESIREEVLQCVWYDQLFSTHGLRTDKGHKLSIVSPGWWNDSEGPDFRGAQIEFNGKLKSGDIEIHLGHDAWKQHGHHTDPRYDDVMLVVALESEPPKNPPITSSGKTIPVLLLAHYLKDDLYALAKQLNIDSYPYEAPATIGHCNQHLLGSGADRMDHLLALAGEWRLLQKANHVKERTERVGMAQTVYEGVMTACGFSRFKYQFRVLAEQFPYDRARQLAQRDPLILEAGYLHVAGLLPQSLPDGVDVPHHAKLKSLREEILPGLRSLPLRWRLLGVRPTNYPERRISGAARFISKSAINGLAESLVEIWLGVNSPKEQREAFEKLFPVPLGFWSNHCTWTGKIMTRPSSPLGAGRARSIIGNVFVPFGLALARQRRDRALEERVLTFYAKLPAEPENRILNVMLQRIFGEQKPPRMTFRLQQGLIQMHYDWCEPNPSCRNCRVLGFMDNHTTPR